MNFVVEFKKLGLGTFEQSFEIDDSFFEQFEFSEIMKGNITISAKIEIKSTAIAFVFLIDGFVEVQCDVCLDLFDYKIEKNTDLFVLIDDGDNVDFDDEKIIIPKTIDSINLAKHFYDDILLSLPIKKVHPLDELGNRTCNPEFLSKLEELETEKKIYKDPRWDKLKKLLK